MNDEVHRMWKLTLALALAGLGFASRAAADGDGALEINMQIVARGAINGDSVADAPGYPVLITKPGSYRLTGNLTTSNPNAYLIAIEADDVTLDLNGFELAGPASCATFPCANSGQGRGIVGSGTHTIVRNGTVRGMGGIGIWIGRSAEIERVRAIENGFTGILLSEPGASVTDSAAIRNGASGILILQGEVRGCVALLNKQAGIDLANGVAPRIVLSENASLANLGAGIVVENGALTDNLISGNGSTGLRVLSSPPLSAASGLARTVIVGNAGSPVLGLTVSTGPNLCNGGPIC